MTSIQSSAEGIGLFSPCSAAAKCTSDIWTEKFIDMLNMAPNPLMVH